MVPVTYAYESSEDEDFHSFDEEEDEELDDDDVVIFLEISFKILIFFKSW